MLPFRAALLAGIGSAGGGSPPPADITLAALGFTTGTSTGDADYTTASLGGLTPNAVFVLGNRHLNSSGSSESDQFGTTFGFVDNGDREMTAGTFCQTAVTTGGATGGSYGNTSNRVHRMLNPGASEDKAGNGLVIADGLRINWVTNSASSRRAGYLAFAGANVSAHVGSQNLGTGTSALDITAPGFQPDAVLVITPNAAMGGSLSAETKFSFGIATATAQRCIAHSEYRTAVSAPFMAILTDSVAAEIHFQTGALTYKVAASAFDASGFSLTPNASAGSDDIGYLALKFTGGAVKLVDFDTPTSTGAFSITGAGFTPRAAIIVITNLEGVDPSFSLTSAATMAGFSITVIDPLGVIQSASQRIQQGTSPQVTRSLFDAALLGPSNTACDALKATFTQWTSDGAEFSASAAQGTAKKGFVLFIQ